MVINMLKNELLKLLEENRGKDLSGQQIAERFRVSRSAVWKAINALKDDGYVIDSAPNRGYRLSEQSDLLSPEGIGAFLTHPLKVITFSSVDSTNSEAKRQISAGLTDPLLLAAECQTAGKGRMGRSFYSPSSTGLYMSLVLHPDTPASEWISITSAAAVAVCLAIEALSGLSPTIKWVNDIYLGDRKICGILTEAITDMENGHMKSVIIGIGINLSTHDFPTEISARAASLYFKEEKPPFSRNQLAAAICDHLLNLADELAAGSWLPLYRSRSYLSGKTVNFWENGIEHRGTVIDIDHRGGLIIDDETGSRHTLSTGEVTVRPVGNDL